MEEELIHITGIITDLQRFTPINIEEEKNKFFADKERTYNPQFKYPETDFSIEEYRKVLERYLLQPQEDDVFTHLVHERIRELLLWLDLHEWKGRKDVARISSFLWGQPSKNILREAQELVNTLPAEPEERELLGKDIIAALQETLTEMGFTNWKIALEEGTTRAQLNTQKNILRIDPKGTFSENDVEKLTIHEILTHVQRYENGTQQDHFIFSLGTAQQLETEEGLATFSEQQAGVLTDQVLRRIALMALSVDFAKTHSFAQTFAYLEHYVDEEKAFTMTMRIKRGFADTSVPGTFSKSHLYFTGYKKLQSLKKEDIPYLFVGKISYIHLPIIKQLVDEGKVRLFS